jgi:galactokinase
VTVVGVTLDGVQPIEADVRRRQPPGVLVRSRDLRKRRLIKPDTEIRDHSDPHDWCALVKAALTVTGYRIADGGLEISLSSRLPKGSGMGTS